MTVTVKAFGSVSTRLKKTGAVVLPDGINLIELKEVLGLPKNYPVCFVVNGVVAPAEQVLKDDDDISIINHIAGG